MAGALWEHLHFFSLIILTLDNKEHNKNIDDDFITVIIMRSFWDVHLIKWHRDEFNFHASLGAQSQTHKAHV